MTMLRTDSCRALRILTVLAVVASLCLPALALPGLAAAPDEKAALADVAPSRESAPVRVTWGKAEIVTVPGDVSDIMIANPAIADVTVVQQNKLYIVGISIGDTNVIALDERGNVLRKIDVHVQYDTAAIQKLVNDLFPEENAKVGSIHDQIILTGTVSTPVVASKIANLVGHYVSDLQDKDDPVDELLSNLMEVSGERQVMLRVKIVEVSRSILKELGVETNFNDPDELVEATVFGRTPPASFSNVISGLLGTNTTGLTQDPFGVGRIVGNTGIRGLGFVEVMINALEQENLLNILAEPNLTAVSGEQAGFLAGGEFPVPVGRDQIGNIIVDFKQFGVALNFRPRVLSAERISLQMNTEVSSLDFENSITLADVNVPGLDVRRAETTVEIASGGSLMIAGLLKSDSLNSLSGLPGIRKTPILGDLISSDSFQREETELVVIVTPYLVEPYAEMEYAEERPEHETSPLASAFATNVRRIFGETDEDLFAGDTRYGYMLD